jgi:hypothetical protein
MRTFWDTKGATELRVVIAGGTAGASDPAEDSRRIFLLDPFE